MTDATQFIRQIHPSFVPARLIAARDSPAKSILRPRQAIHAIAAPIK